jgi:hypothetical protein
MLYGASAKADVTLATSSTLTSWDMTNGAPVYTSITAPNVATTNQNNNGVTSTGATNYALVETFTPSSSYTLAGLAMSVTGGGTATPLSLHLYDVTSAITSNNGTTTQGSGATYSVATSTLTDLFGNGAGLAFNQPPSGGVQDIFTLSNGSTNDLVPLTAGHIYAVELWVSYAINTFTWVRAGVVATDGQMMFSADPNNVGTGPISLNPANYAHEDSRVTITSAGFAGGAPRTASLALYAVPEPSSLLLLGLAAPAMTWAVRRRVRR